MTPDVLRPGAPALWCSTPNHQLLEMAALLGYGAVVLDVEHGSFTPESLDRLVPFAGALGLSVLVKVLAPTPESVGQALDLGAPGVVVPHVLGAEHARAVCDSAKFAPLGTRSFAGGRTVRYGAPDEAWFDAQNRATACFPMIESREALEDVEAILQLPGVDGVFLGPSDLSLSRGRGRYARTQEDAADFARVAQAARGANKPWIMPAWHPWERDLARRLGVGLIVAVEEQGLLYEGLRAMRDQLAREAVA